MEDKKILQIALNDLRLSIIDTLYNIDLLSDIINNDDRLLEKYNFDKSFDEVLHQLLDFINDINVYK